MALAVLFVPSHVNETTEPVDNLGGVLSALMVGGLILAINFAPVPNETKVVVGLAAVAVAAGVGFFIRQSAAAVPLYDLDIASRRIFWVAACAGIIVFGSLMGAMFVGQQYLQNVLGYSSLEAGLAIIPAALFMVLIVPRSAKLVEANGSRLTLLSGYVFCFLGFLTMLVLWERPQPVLAHRARVRVHRRGRGVRRNARVALAHWIGARVARAWRRERRTSSAISAGPSCSRSWAHS